MRGRSVLARVERVVFGAWNEEMGAVGTLWDVVRDRRLNHRPEVVSGVLADECVVLLREFFDQHRDSEPVDRRSGNLCGGSVSERPKEHASKACEGATPPWVQIPPLPPHKRLDAIGLLVAGAQGPAEHRVAYGIREQQKLRLRLNPAGFLDPPRERVVIAIDRNRLVQTTAV